MYLRKFSKNSKQSEGKKSHGYAYAVIMAMGGEHLKNCTSFLYLNTIFKVFLFSEILQKKSTIAQVNLQEKKKRTDFLPFHFELQSTC